tara:strand:- start:680 stop:1885 length:1206 start_codon:yes stop_codon:yes gene_type:complete
MTTCTILGLGYIGLPTSLLIANSGHSVIGIDINEEVINKLKQGKSHLSEKGIEELLQSTLRNKSLCFRKEISKSEIFIIAVPTPFINKKEGIPKPNTEFVFNAAKSISKVIEKNNLIILESTCPVGTTEKVAEIITENSGLSNEEFDLCYCPERVLPGNIIKELINNDRVIGSENVDSANKCKNFYETFCTGEIVTTTSKTAELVKLAENSYRDVNIAFANELSIICSELAINPYKLIDIANNHPRVNILKPSCGVGGHCIAVDPWFIASEFEKSSKLIQIAREVNLFKTEWCIEKIKKIASKIQIEKNIKPTIGCLGITYKPDVDDLRESPALKINNKLIEEGFKVMTCEPNINQNFEIPLWELEEVLIKSDLLVILISHKEFKKIDFKNYNYIDLCGIA